MMQYLNSNGLVDGNIPKQTACPFYESCKLKNSNCPSNSNLKSNDFSCAAARANSLVKIVDNKSIRNIFQIE